MNNAELKNFLEEQGWAITKWKMWKYYSDWETRQEATSPSGTFAFEKNKLHCLYLQIEKNGDRRSYVFQKHGNVGRISGWAKEGNELSPIWLNVPTDTLDKIVLCWNWRDYSKEKHDWIAANCGKQGNGYLCTKEKMGEMDKAGFLV